MRHKIITGALGALLAAGALAGTVAVAQAAPTPIVCHLAGTSTPVPGNGHLMYTSATEVCTAKTGMYVTVTLTDNADHAKATATNTNVGVAELATGSATLPAIAGHSYGAIVTYWYQATADTGTWTKRSVVFPGPRATIGADGLEWD